MKLSDIQARCDRVPFFRHLGFSVTEANHTHFVASMPFEQRHIGNPLLGTYHGGIIASFMEALASLTVLGDLNSLPPKPVNLTVDYLRPGLPGTLNARASMALAGLAKRLFIKAWPPRSGRLTRRILTIFWRGLPPAKT